MEAMFDPQHRHVRDEILSYLDLYDLSVVAAAGQVGRQAIAKYSRNHPTQYAEAASQALFPDLPLLHSDSGKSTSGQDRSLTPFLLDWMAIWNGDRLGLNRTEIGFLFMRFRQPDFLINLSPSYADKVDQWGKDRWKVMGEEWLIWASSPSIAFVGSYTATVVVGLVAASLIATIGTPVTLLWDLSTSQHFAATQRLWSAAIHCGTAPMRWTPNSWRFLALFCSAAIVGVKGFYLQEKRNRIPRPNHPTLIKLKNDPHLVHFGKRGEIDRETYMLGLLLREAQRQSRAPTPAG